MMGRARKLLGVDSGEGRLCHPDGQPSPEYPDDGPTLGLCPIDPTSSTGERMRCERLDPMFCPDSSFCTSWDCKCYGPGNNDNTTISGLLGETVFNGGKSTLSCGCPTYEYPDKTADSGTSTLTMEETSMPFEDKADQYQDRVNAYECCADWFTGYQCTLWDYSNGSAPVCLNMYDSHVRRACAATSCCSAYIFEVGADWDLGPPGGGGPGGHGMFDPYMFDPYMFGGYGYDGYGYGMYGGYGYDGYGYGGGNSGFYGGPPMTPSAGPGLGGDTCEIQIQQPGTFIGSFQMWQNGQQSDEAELLSAKQPGSRSRAPGVAKGHPDADGVMRFKKNERVVFKGTFVPDSPSLTTSSQPSATSSLETDAPAQDPFFTVRNFEAIQGAPGSPGGQKALRDAGKAAKRATARAKQATIDSLKLKDMNKLAAHRRHLLTTGNTTAGNVSKPGIVTGQVFLCEYDYILRDNGPEIVQDWILHTLHSDSGIDPKGRGTVYSRSDITLDVIQWAQPYTCTAENLCSGPNFCNFEYGAEGYCQECEFNPLWDCDKIPSLSPTGRGACKIACSPHWATNPMCEYMNEGQFVFELQIKEESHRERVLELLKNDLMGSEWVPPSGYDFFPSGNQDPYGYERESYWVEGPILMYCGDGIASPGNHEVCDLGTDNMDAHSACNDCECNTGFSFNSALGICMCSAEDASATIDAVETSSVQGAENTLIFAIHLTLPVTGRDATNNVVSSPTVVTISGLSGPSTPSGVVPISCKHSLPTYWTDATTGDPKCELGLRPLALDTNATFRYAMAEWSKEEGSLKFTVLGDLTTGAETRLSTFQLSVTLKNSDRLQIMRRPEVSVCHVRAADTASSYQSLGLFETEVASGALLSSGYILGANGKFIRGPATGFCRDANAFEKCKDENTTSTGFSPECWEIAAKYMSVADCQFNQTNVSQNQASSECKQAIGLPCKHWPEEFEPTQIFDFTKPFGSSAEVLVLRVSVPEASLPVNSELFVYGTESIVGKGLSASTSRRIPYIEGGDIQQVLAGATNTMLKIVLQDRTSKRMVQFLGDGIVVEHLVDQSLVRVRGRFKNSRPFTLNPTP
jgi:hypothetical protein